jgi:hypothetical protein
MDIAPLHFIIGGLCQGARAVCARKSLISCALRKYTKAKQFSQLAWPTGCFVGGCECKQSACHPRPPPRENGRRAHGVPPPQLQEAGARGGAVRAAEIRPRSGPRGQGGGGARAAGHPGGRRGPQGGAARLLGGRPPPRSALRRTGRLRALHAARPPPPQGRSGHQTADSCW